MARGATLHTHIESNRIESNLSNLESNLALAYARVRNAVYILMQTRLEYRKVPDDPRTVGTHTTGAHGCSALRKIALRPKKKGLYYEGL